MPRLSRADAERLTKLRTTKLIIGHFKESKRILQNLAPTDISSDEWKAILTINEKLLGLCTHSEVLSTKETSVKFVEFIRCTAIRDAKGAAEIASGLITNLTKMLED